MHAFGDVGPLAEMRELVRRSTPIHAYEPDPASDRWTELYARFRALLGSEVVTR
jgi:hypothetical protein